MSHARVLIVERDDNVRLTIQSMLESQGHEVVAVEWSNAAFEPLSAQVFDMAIIGHGNNIFHPPHVLAWIIRASCPDTAIILMTGRGQTVSGPSPFDHTLFKPFSIEQIQQIIALSMPRPHGEAAPNPAQLSEPVSRQAPSATARTPHPYRS